VGDILACYIVRLSRWSGLLKVASPAFMDTAPVFDNPDPFVWRFKVEPLVVLDLQHSIPIYNDTLGRASL
jgi:hypothetical protein